MLNKDKEYTNFKFPTIFQEFIYTRTYSRWLEEEGRRESWEETVKRYIDYMKEKLGDKITAKEAKDVYQAILNFEVMPSMRALWAAGGAADADNLALYNCSFIAIENLKNFAEILYILMNGTGAGFTVEKEYISKLPIVSEEVSAGPIVPIIFEDSKQGWAKGFEQVLHCLWTGLPFECDYSKIRPRGARLKTMGGRASGPEPLKELIRFVTDIAERNRGHQIQSIDAHDICCKIADIVVVGGVRRCLPYNALIPTSNGVKQIKDIVAGDLIETGGEYHIVKGKVFSGKQTTLIIKHAFGEIECTPRHKIAIFESNSTTFKYKMAKDIKKGDCLVWDSLGYSGKKTELPKFNEKYHFNSKKFIIPEITTDIAWLIGLIHGDGHIAERTIEITANTKERVVLECAKDIFKKFNLNSKISKGNGDCLRLRVHSAALCRWFTQHIKKANKDIYIPSFIRDAEKEIRSAYLAGLFDADGRSRNDGVCEQATTIYKSFSEEVTALLAGLGIGSSIYEGSAENRRLNNIEAKDFYSIIVKGITNRQKWVNTIGIYTKGVKSAKIGTIIGSPVDFKYKASMLGYPEGWRKEGYVTLASAVEHGFIENPIYYPTVVENITEGVEIDTYDIEIDGVCRFTTGGLVVHNSACISLSDLDDRTMANAKKGEFWNSQPQRMLANNSAVYNRKPSVSMFLEEWKHLYQSNSGERGIFNRMAGKKKAAENHRRDASKVQGTNPCFSGDTIIAVADGRNGITIQSLAEEDREFPVYSAEYITTKNQFGDTGKFSHWKTVIKKAKAFKSGTKEIIEVVLSDGSIIKCTPEHLLATKDGRWIEAQFCEGEYLAKFYTFSNKNSNKNYRTINSITNAYARQYRMIWEYHNGSYNGKEYNVDHISSNAYDDSIENLQLLSYEEHLLKSKESKLGEDNPIHRMDAFYRRWINKKRNISANAKKYSWSEERKQEALDVFLQQNPKPEIEDNNTYYNDPIYVQEIIWTTEVCDVYDLTVEDTHNFYIITDTDDGKYMNCSGVLVHNCGEILLRSAELCNLSEVIVRPEDTFDTLKQKVKLATIIGTWQSTFTNFNYIDDKWKENCDEERLLGVSLTGLRDHPVLGHVNDTAKKWLSDLKHVTIQTNKKVAQRLEINRAAAITCVKPSGTVSLLVDSAPGAHVRQTKTGYYIRRVRISATDPLFRMLGEQGMPFQCEVGQTPDSCSTYVLEFVCKAPTSANREKETAIEQLEYWKMVRTFWCEHNPSITVSVKEDEWLDTAAWVYKNFDDICGVSFLPSSDHVYLLAPYEDVTKEQYEKLVKEMPQIDFTKLSEYELEDATQGSKEYACQGGSCEII